jgi:hypothetical protein
MAKIFASAALWLFMLNLAVALGAGLYEHRIVAPQWFSGPDGTWNATAAKEADVGLRFWAFVTTGPLTLLMIANFVAAFAAGPGPLRFAWLAAAFLVLADRVLTFGYFIPTMIRLMSGEIPLAAATESARTWLKVNHARHALNLLALVFAIRAYGLLQKT